MTKSNMLMPQSSLEQYLAEINKFPLLSREEEYETAKQWQSNNDMAAAQKLVTSNLRFVVKIAYEYKNYDVKLVDLIQEGNIGLMKAVRKFNPDRGYRLISYAVWWIKAYMQNYIIKNWSMVKIGSTARHRAMLFGSRKAKEELFHDDGEVMDETFLLPATSSMNVGELRTLNTDIARRDFSLDAALDEDGRSAYIDLIRSDGSDAEHLVGTEETRKIVGGHLEGVVNALNDRERFILEKRLIADEAMTLQEIGDHFHVTRERARQLEANLKKKLARAITEFDSQSAEVTDII